MQFLKLLYTVWIAVAYILNTDLRDRVQ